MEDHQVKVACDSAGLGSNDVPSATSFISVRSSMICAETVATFLHENHLRIQQELEEGLLLLGYKGGYRLQAGFDEDYLRGFYSLHPRVFLFLDGDLQHDPYSISRVISPIFSPHAVVLYAKSQTYPLIEFHELGGQGPQESSSCLSSAPSQQPSDASGHLSEGRSEKPPQNYRRRLKLDLDVPLIIESGKSSLGFNISTLFNLELRSNRKGDSENWPEIKTIARSERPLCSINFEDISISLGPGEAYSLENLQVRMTATPVQTMCRDISPIEATVCTDSIKASQETHKKLGANATIGPKPEAKLEMGCEQVGREETTKASWNINAHTFKQVELNSRKVTIDYTRHRSASEQEKPDLQRTWRFSPLPNAVFTCKSDEVTRTVEIRLQALWVIGSQKSNRFRPLLQGMSSFPLHNNFFHEISVTLNLKDLIDQGGDDLILKGDTTNIAQPDIIQRSQGVDQEALFKEVEIRTKADGESLPLRLPLNHATIKALQGQVGQVKGTEPKQYTYPTRPTSSTSSLQPRLAV